MRDPLTRFKPQAFMAPLALTGLAFAWSRAGEMGAVAFWIAWALLVLAAMSFSAVAFGLAGKALLRARAAAQDLADAGGAIGYAAGALSLTMIGQLCALSAPEIGGPIWLAGSAAAAGLSIAFAAQLLAGRLSFANASPAWLLPLSGALMAPLAVPALGHEDFAAACFGIGLFGLILGLPLIVVRLAFHDRPPRGAVLAHLLMPPALGFQAYAALSGMIDHAALALFGVAAATLICILRIGASSFRGWAAVFPMAQFAAGLLAITFEFGFVALIAASALFAIALLDQIARRNEGQ